MMTSIVAATAVQNYEAPARQDQLVVIGRFQFVFADAVALYG
jgi:hypothetical protein